MGRVVAVFALGAVTTATALALPPTPSDLYQPVIRFFIRPRGPAVVASDHLEMSETLARSS